MLLGFFPSKGEVVVRVILKKHVSFRSIDSKHSPCTDLVKMTKLSQYFHYKKMFSLPAVCALQWIHQPDTLFFTQP